MAEEQQDDHVSAKLAGTKKLLSPVFALASQDMLGDGPRELIALTMHSLHVFQVDAHTES